MEHLVDVANESVGFGPQQKEELLEGEGLGPVQAALALLNMVHGVADVFHAQINPLHILRSFMV